MAFRMPPEWAPHRRTWMAWPCSPFTIELVGSKEAAWDAWAAVANAIAAFEPVAMVCNRGDGVRARSYLGPRVSIVETELGDSWIRDSGPTFVVDEAGRLGAVDWTFNGWGGRTFPRASADAEVARFVATQTGAVRLASRLVNEGGAIHVDGEGTLLVTESVLLNRNRNPSWTREEIAAELNARLGTTKVIWLPRGLAADESDPGTDGHVDMLACFIGPGIVAVHGQPDPQHPDYEAAAEIRAILASETDARGRELEVVVLDAPEERFADDAPLACSYVNFSFVNGGIVLCAFDDPQDEEVARLFRHRFGDRRVVSVDAEPIFRAGGGIHCITQQEPLCAANGADNA